MFENFFEIDNENFLCHKNFGDFTGYEFHKTMMKVNIFNTKCNVFLAFFHSQNFDQGVS